MHKNDHQNTFTQFLSATISSRAILLQLMPGMTAPALLLVGLSECPIFVFSAKLRTNLTPLILWDAWTLATQRIRVSSIDGKTTTWKVFTLSCWLFARDSRLIRYVEVVILNLVALGVVFFPLKSSKLGILLLVISFIRGLMRYFSALVSIHDFFFHTDSIATSVEFEETDRNGRLSTESVNIITLDHIYDDFDGDDRNTYGDERRSSYKATNKHRQTFESSHYASDRINPLREKKSYR